MLICLALFVLTITYVMLSMKMMRTTQCQIEQVKSQIELAKHVENIYKILGVHKTDGT